MANVLEFFANTRERLQGHGVGAVFARGASGSFGVMALGAVMTLCTNMLLTRVMGVAQYGIYIYILTWINLLVLVCKFGMDTSLVRFVAAYNAKHDWGLFRGIVGHSYKFVMLASFFIGIIAVSVIYLIHDHIGVDRSKTFVIALLLLPVLSLTALRQAILRGLKHVVLAALPDSLIRPLLVTILTGGFYIFSTQQLAATKVMLFTLAAALAAFFIGSIWLVRVLPKKVGRTPSVYARSEWLTVSLPLFFISGMSVLLHQADIIMIGIILNTDQAGIYAVSSRIAGLVAFGLSAINAIAASIISELYSTGQHMLLQKIVTQAARGLFVFTLISSLFLSIYGKLILGFFGAEFVNGYLSLLVLLVGQSVSSLVGSVGLLMTMTGHQKQAAFIIGVGAIANIILNAVLISWLDDMIGAAIATAVTTVLLNLVMLAKVLQKLNINPTVLVRG